MLDEEKVTKDFKKNFVDERKREKSIFDIFFNLIFKQL